MVSLCLHLSIDTYFHPDRPARFFFGFGGYFGFFTVRGEVVNNVPADGLSFLIGVSVGHGSEEDGIVVDSVSPWS